MARQEIAERTSGAHAARAARRAPMREFSRSLPMSLLRAREAVMRQFRPSLRNHGLTEQQWRILRALAAVDAIEVTELARVAFLLGPSLSRILRDLEARELIERAHGEGRSAPRRGLDLAKGPEADRGRRADVGGDLCRDHQRYGARKLAELQEMLGELESSLARWKSPATGMPRRRVSANLHDDAQADA